MTRTIVIRENTSIAVADEMKSMLGERTRSKAATRLMAIGRMAIATALAERDPKRRRKLLTQFGFN